MSSSTRPRPGAERLTLSLDGLAYGGDAFGRDAAGRMAFVPFALPGERVLVEVVESHARWCRTRLVEVLEPSPDRVTPRCRHFGECGGCHYQHLASAAQPAAKRAIVQAQLERLGGFRQPPVTDTIPSPSAWNARNHMQFSLTADGRIGLQAARSHRVIALEECHLPAQAIADLWPALQLDPMPGLERLALRCSGDETQIVFHATHDPDVELELDRRASAVWLSPFGAHVLAGASSLVHDVRGRLFRVHAGSFFQAHPDLTPRLVDQVLAGAQAHAGQTAFDLYAGVGLFSAFLSERGLRLRAVEQAASACEDFAFNLAATDDIELFQAVVEDALAALPAHPDVIVADPPRAGLGRPVVEGLAALGAPRLVYVSCDPSTLARDGRWLTAAGYRLEQVTPIDMFPQTFHIETVSVWTR